MTAIAGVWRLDGRHDAAEACAQMLAAQRAYGPDVSNQWDNGIMAAGRALFRSVPEDAFDRQPLAGAGGRLLLVADIRLDNRDDIAAALGIGGPGNLCDAAILLVALERWGEASLDQIVGDFAFALFDLENRHALLVRDPLGQRPLHYHRSPGLFAFASMPKGLHALPEIPRAPDEDRVAEFVALLPETGNRTYFKDIDRVEPGHVVTVSGTGVSVRRYWEPERRATRFRNPGDYAEGLRHHVDQATRARLRGASNAAGTHLSAGLDSSIITTTAAREIASSGGRIVAFTSVPQFGLEPSPNAARINDEGPYAAATAARHRNIEHVLIRGDGTPPLGNLDRYFYLFEQPVRDLPSGDWVCAINAAARDRKLSVMLPAYMGNLTLSYNGFERLPQDILHGRWLRWAYEYAAIIRTGQMSWKGALATSFGPFISSALWRGLNWSLRRRALDVTAYTGLHRRWASMLGERARSRDLDFSYRPRRDGFSARLWALRRTDMGNINKGTLAGWGIDQRDPTTDRRLVEFCLGIPEDQYLAGGITRALARRAFADRVPASTLTEHRRGHQSADWHVGFRKAQAQIQDELARLKDCAPADNILDLERLRRLVDAWPQDGWNREAASLSYRVTLLRALAVGHFLRKASGSNR